MSCISHLHSHSQYSDLDSSLVVCRVPCFHRRRVEDVSSNRIIFKKGDSRLKISGE